MCLLGKICGLKKVETPRELGSLHYEGLYDVIKYDSGDQIKNLEMGGHVARMEGEETYMQDFVGETRGNEAICKT